MKFIDSKLKTDVFKVDGSTLYFIDDILFVCPNEYTHFFKIEDAYEYYKQLQKIVNKKVIFVFNDYELTIDDKTTLEEILIQLEFQKSLNINESNDDKEYNIIHKNNFIKKLIIKK